MTIYPLTELATTIDRMSSQNTINTRSRSNNPIGTRGQSPDNDTASDMIRVNTPVDVEVLQAENRRLREQLEAYQHNVGNATARHISLNSSMHSDKTSDASERSEACRMASNTATNLLLAVHEPKVSKLNKFS